MSALTTLMLSFVLTTPTGFVVEQDGDILTLFENGIPVLVYRIQPVQAPEGVPEHQTRAGYIHPLYDPAGNPLTEDFPEDHYHHRGVFVAWPEVWAGERNLNVWALGEARPHVRSWRIDDLGSQKAAMTFNSIWSFDDVPEIPVLEEQYELTVHTLHDNKRAIDIVMTYTNRHDSTVEFHGAPEENKGYGGLNIRPDSTREPLSFTAQTGVVDEDKLYLESPWVDVSYAISAENLDGEKSGVAIFQHPENPGYPHPGWILRHYGFMGVSWPHTESHVLEPGASFTLRYRILTHMGNAAEAEIENAFNEYVTAQQ